jgi:phage tail protein X
MTTQTLIELADEYAGRSQLTEEAGEAARQQLLDALEAQAVDLDVQAGSIEAVQAANQRLADERDALRSELAALKAQPSPVAQEVGDVVAWVLLRVDDDGLEPVMFYGGKDKPSGEFKERFTLRPVCFADTQQKGEQ